MTKHSCSHRLAQMAAGVLIGVGLLAGVPAAAAETVTGLHV